MHNFNCIPTVEPECTPNLVAFASTEFLYSKFNHLQFNRDDPVCVFFLLLFNDMIFHNHFSNYAYKYAFFENKKI